MLSGGYLEKLIIKAKNCGYVVTIVYLFVNSPDVSIDRIKIRVLNGGHFLPYKDVIRRFYRSKKLFLEKYRYFADNWFAYYNADEIFEKICDSKNGILTIYDEIKWDDFAKDAE